MRNFVLILLTSLGFCCISQTRYLVVFTDKVEVDFDPVSYFDTAALKSFKVQGLPTYDWYDLPVNSSYIKALSPFINKSTELPISVKFFFNQGPSDLSSSNNKIFIYPTLTQIF